MYQLSELGEGYSGRVQMRSRFVLWIAPTVTTTLLSPLIVGLALALASLRPGIENSAPVLLIFWVIIRGSLFVCPTVMVFDIATLYYIDRRLLLAKRSHLFIGAGAFGSLVGVVCTPILTDLLGVHLVTFARAAAAGLLSGCVTALLLAAWHVADLRIQMRSMTI